MFKPYNISIPNFRPGFFSIWYITPRHIIMASSRTYSSKGIDCQNSWQIFSTTSYWQFNSILLWWIYNWQINSIKRECKITYSSYKWFFTFISGTCKAYIFPYINSTQCIFICLNIIKMQYTTVKVCKYIPVCHHKKLIKHIKIKLWNTSAHISCVHLDSI